MHLGQVVTTGGLGTNGMGAIGLGQHGAHGDLEISDGIVNGSRGRRAMLLQNIDIRDNLTVLVGFQVMLLVRLAEV